VEDGGVVRSRPICAYPAASKWDGAGDPDEAGSFTCVSENQQPVPPGR
jgi:feruloyl esterase